jgi:hypothetical protein
VRSTNEDGKEDTLSERIDLPPDIANGLVLTLLKDMPLGASAATVSMLATSPKPRLVTLEILQNGEDLIKVAGPTRWRGRRGRTNSRKTT